MNRIRSFVLSVLLVCSSFAPQIYSPVNISSQRVSISAPAAVQIPPATPTEIPVIVHPISNPTAIPIKRSLSSTPIPNPESIKPAQPDPTLDSIPTLQYLEGCLPGLDQNCRNPRSPTLPKAPPGYAWKRLEGKYTFSAYVHPNEDAFMGDRLDIPGVGGVQAKEGFLYGVDGIGMQGGGFVQGINHQGVLDTFYIRYISGHWELDGKDVFIQDEWYYSETGEVVPTVLIGKILLSDARFAMDKEPHLTPYYSVAAPTRFEIGTKIYVPGLESFGGIFEVQDRGGSFGKDSQRFDIYVGREMEKALEWFRLGAMRSDLVVYILVKQGEVE